MYIPHANRIEETETMLTFMHQYSFATLVRVVEGSPFASHLPLTIVNKSVNERVNEGEQVILHGHFAKANPHWRVHQQPSEVLVIFHGPHAYISPSQYEAHQSVPTWNYVAVHAYGQLQLLDPGEATLAVLEQLIATNQPSYQQQWESLPDTYKRSMLNGIVAFAIKVTRLEGKSKLSQNRSVVDQMSVANWLASHDDPTDREVGRLMRENLEKVNQ